MESPFIGREKIIENEQAFAVYDKFSVNKGHSLVIQKKEIVDLFESDVDEYEAFFKKMEKSRLKHPINEVKGKSKQD